MRRTLLALATVCLLALTSGVWLDSVPASAAKKRCKAGQVAATITTGKAKKRRTRIVCVARARTGSASDALRASNRAALPRRYRKVLDTRVAKRLDKTLARAVGELREVTVKQSQVVAKTETVNRTETIADTATTKTTKTVRGTGESEGSNETGADVTTTVDTVETSKGDGKTATARRQLIRRVRYATEACPDAGGRAGGNVRISEEKRETYPSPDGGTVTLRTHFEYDLDVTGTVAESARFSSFAYKAQTRSESSAKTSGGRTVASATATGKDAGSNSTIGELGKVQINNPSATSSTPEGATGAMLGFVSIEAQVARKELAGKFFGRESAWYDAERCVKLDANPASLSLDVGESRPTTATLTDEGAPLSKTITATLSGSVTATPSSGTGPSAPFTVLLTAQAGGAVKLESISNQGRGTETVSAAYRKPPEPPVPAAYSGTVAATRTDVTGSASVQVTISGSARFAPPMPQFGTGTQYSLASGGGMGTFSSTGGSCDVNGTGPVAFSGYVLIYGTGGPPSTYQLFVQLEPPALVTATRSGCDDPSQNGTTTNVPLAAFGAALTRTPMTGAADGSISGGDMYTESNGFSTTTYDYSWVIGPSA